MRHALLLGRLLNQSLMVEPRALDAMMPGLLSVLLAQAPAPRAMEDDGEDAPPPPPFVMLAPGIAGVTVHGALARYAGMIDLRSCTMVDSYQACEQRIAAALADPAVRAVALIIDSPGGEVSGCFEFCDRLAAAARGPKPIWAIADDRACSAAYLIAAACAQAWATETADVGSIGVMGVHCDMSGYDAQMGLKYTYIYSGAHKVDGNPHEPLPEAVRAVWTAEFDELRAMFAGRVAAWRGLSLDAVLATEARVYAREAALAEGLVDRIGTLDRMLVEMSAALAAGESLPRGAAAQIPGNRKGEQMNTVANPGGLAPLVAALPQTSTTAVAPPAATAPGAVDAQVAAVAGPAPASDRNAEAAAIVERCAQAGQPARAADFLGKGMSLAQVRQILNAEEVAAAEKTAVSSYGGGGAATGGAPPAAAAPKIDIAAIYSRMNQVKG